MDSKRSDRPGDKNLSSSEYRTRLLTKLNCLIAVLEVAIAKISRSMDQPGANEERLLKIRGNLENTLSICSRAKQTLEAGTAGKPLLRNPASRNARRTHKMSYRDYVELSSIEEYQKFKNLPPIKAEEIHETDIDGLIEQLFAN
jgi:hypothetical protein